MVVADRLFFYFFYIGTGKGKKVVLEIIKLNIHKPFHVRHICYLAEMNVLNAPGKYLKSRDR